MCDYSLEYVQSRPAKVGEKLRIQRFNLGTRGFASPDDFKTAVCVLPGTELAFAELGNVLRACRVARREAQGVQPHHGNLPASE